ncbi:TrmH family RNA methyltransferase [Bifidobacterium scardovii]|uniref:rRNA methylase n=1 Tax=Bifidobacterium scardovii TaxID=158787 RepID=A0A087DIC9_9BIFI|nr:RNA methyltransferase [Bifidobacterium scardovii]KFI95279.1 rRNA methylase [Bifidobacterium scardovii]MBS6946860.1 RNA methyltransferase [Bifidobacterium scardovii]MDK6349778.1 RNA methyltransferase [Bifidobacterium scardovii]MDU3735568.1 RNA methyltransferase [Bifidobacterium scardovii]MDU5297420.1 RNA methyltransferase [Bifidobacterium scardovii]
MPISAEVLANPKAERIRRAGDLSNRKSRERAGRFLIEGPQSVREAIAWHPGVVRDLYVQVASGAPDAPFANPTVAQLAGKALSAGVYVHKATRDVIAKISSDAQGIVAVGDLGAMRDAMRYDGPSERPFVAAFWQVRDPGNAGTVIRAADAAGCDAIVFVDECVDMFNPKVIRSTAGSLFHLPVLTMGTDEFLAWASEHGAGVIAADVYGTEGRPPQPLPDMLAGVDAEGGAAADRAGCAVLFGNEARGLPAAILERADRIVAIPLYGKAESLNLGTSAAVMLMSMAMSSRFGRM